MGKSIVKIQRSDIKEMVSSCVRRVLNERDYYLETNPDEGKISYSDMYRYRFMRDNDKNICAEFYTDNKRYAVQFSDTAMMYSTDIVMPKNMKVVNLGEIDEKDLTIDKLAEYSQQSRTIIFYPDNRTTCIVTISDFGRQNDGGEYFNPGYVKKNLDPSEIEFRIVSYIPGRNFDIDYIDLIGHMHGLSLNLGSATVRSAKGEKNIEDVIRREIPGKLRLKGELMNFLKQEIDFTGTFHVLYFTLNANAQNIGLGEFVLNKLIEKYGSHDHYMICFSTRFNEEGFDAFAKIASKTGFRLLDYAGDFYVYYK